MYQRLLQDRIDARRLSIRRAAQEIGISHTTLRRLIAGDPADLDTLDKVSTWLGVNLPDLLRDQENAERGDTVFAFFAAAHPDLYDALLRMVNQVNVGLFSASEIAALTSFADFLLFRDEGERSGRNPG